MSRNVGVVERPPKVRYAHDIEIRKGDDQGNSVVNAMICASSQCHVQMRCTSWRRRWPRPHIKLLGHRFSDARYMIMKKGAPTDIDENHREAGPVGVAEPGNRPMPKNERV